MLSQQHFCVTPPQSVTGQSLTPPPSDKKGIYLVLSILARVEAQKAGHGLSISTWDSYTLNEKEYKDLVQLLQTEESLWGFWRHKIRHDYLSSTRQLIFRMLTELHENMIISVVKELQIQLRIIASGRDVAARFAREVEPRGSATIQFADKDEYSKHDPDAQFRHSQAKYPGVVIEISYSQKRKDLRHIAEDYILGSNGDIRVVIGIDVEYRGSKRATLSIWRPQIVNNDAGERELVATQAVIDQEFRDHEGNIIESAAADLNLQLGDFATTALVEPCGSLSNRIRISAATLCANLKHAEEAYAVLTENTGVVRSTMPWISKRRRESTPPKAISFDREKRFKVKDDKAENQASDNDSSYKASVNSD